uniref:LytR/AlgR family response regulator transcription factor n=1 Tax=Parendozoicomonas callyspongiae TaxID=2942213 RepID=UPI002FCCD53A
MKVLICDDEPLARERLKTMLDKTGGIETVEDTAANGTQALELIEKNQPDIVLLDIQMPGMDGLTCAQKIADMETPPAVIFCTAYNQHALDAFKAQAVGYLLKPIRQSELAKSLKQAQRLTQSQITALNARNHSNEEHVVARTRQGVELIPASDITLFQADQKYVTVSYPKGEVLIDEPLKSLQERLGDSFVRIHRNALVARKAIESMSQSDDGFYVLNIKGLNEPVTVSRRHVSSVRRVIQGTSR